jgi:hypothetical protein
MPTDRHYRHAAILDTLMDVKTLDIYWDTLRVELLNTGDPRKKALVDLVDDTMALSKGQPAVSRIPPPMRINTPVRIVPKTLSKHLASKSWRSI